MATVDLNTRTVESSDLAIEEAIYQFLDENSDTSAEALTSYLADFGYEVKA